MLNTMIVVKMKKTNFSEWKKLFDGDAEIEQSSQGILWLER